VDGAARPARKIAAAVEDHAVADRRYREEGPGHSLIVYGVARRRSASIALAHAPAVEFEQGILGRLFGYGTLVAGDFEVPYVPDARRIRKLVR